MVSVIRSALRMMQRELQSMDIIVFFVVQSQVFKDRVCIKPM